MYEAAAPAGEPATPLASSLEEFSPTAVRYIKLGKGGSWAQRAFSEGILPLSFNEIEHESCLRVEWEAMPPRLRAAGISPGVATRWVNELRDFYELDDRCLWITFADGHLWWTFAEQEVVPITGSASGSPERYRRSIGGWRRTDLAGNPLATRSLSSALLKTGGYQMTICRVERQDYLLRRIRGEPDPLHLRSLQLRADMVSLTGQMIQQLDWREFEILIDLIFERGGWQRSSAIGEGEVDVDLVLTSPTTGETAWVQVKSSATQAVVDDYLARFERDGSCQRFFFASHTAKSALTLPARQNLHLWTGDALSAAALKAGMFDWLIERTR